MHVPVASRLPVAIAGWALVAACATGRPNSLVERDLLLALEIADELERGRHLALARAQLAAVLARAPEHELAPFWRLRRCNLWGLDGRPSRADRCYREVTGSHEAVALASYRRALLALERGERSAARRGLLGVLRDFPQTGAAERSLHAAGVLAEEDGGDAERAALLDEVGALLVGAGAAKEADAAVRELYMETLVRSAELMLGSLGAPKAALERLDRALAMDRGSNWRDDARFRRAQALIALERDSEALLALDELITERESSWWFGSYDSAFLDDAMFAKADLLERRGQLQRARAAYAALVREVPTSRLVDDAAFHAARLAESPTELERFVREHPDSRHVPHAQQLLQRSSP